MAWVVDDILPALLVGATIGLGSWYAAKRKTYGWRLVAFLFLVAIVNYGIISALGWLAVG
jgi:hypothetical protein